MKRVIVCTDIRGKGEPDDSFSLAHLLCFQEYFDLLGVVITRPAGKLSSYQDVLKAFKADKVKYGFICNTDITVKIGSTSEAPSQGWSTPTAGSKFIIEEAKLGEVIILAWGSCNDIAQAVHDEPSIVPNLKLFLGGTVGYNYDKEPCPYEYLRKNKKLMQIWPDKSGGGGLNAGSGKYGPKGFVKQVIKPCGKLGKLLAELAPYTTTGGLKWGDSQGVLFTMTNGWDNPSKQTWGGKFQKIPGTNRWKNAPNCPVKRIKALKQWEKRLGEFYGK